MDRTTHKLGTALVGASLLWNTVAWSDGSCIRHSPDHTAALLELYTSEGCSSCPPADRWLSRYVPPGSGQRQVVPLSLHVDYWDNLGWKDRYASPLFTERQHVLTRQAHSGFVYTPEIFVDRQEFRQAGADEKLRQRIAAVNARPAQASIEMVMQPVDHGVLPLQLHIELKSGAVNRHQNAYVAVYENDLTSQIGAGENHGATLHHDYVVRRWLGPIPLTAAAQEYRAGIALDSGWKTRSLGIAAFVEDSADGNILQAMATPICAD